MMYGCVKNTEIFYAVIFQCIAIKSFKDCVESRVDED
jgi:hypothetical protein